MNWVKEVSNRIEEAIGWKKEELKHLEWKFKEQKHYHLEESIKSLKSEIEGMRYAWVVADLTNDDYEKEITND